MPIFLPFFPKLLTPLFLPIIFSSMATTIHRRKAEIDRTSCLDEFDAGLRKQCMRGEWEEKYYFESGSQTCRLFWYDGCPFAQGSRNFFDSLMECQWLCEPSPKADVCFEPFDEHLRDECANGELRRRFYFDRQKLRCVPFWSDGCESESGNQFDDEDVCMQRCELPRTTNQQTQRPLRPSNIYASRLITTTPFPDKLLRKPPPAAFGSTTSAAGVGSKGPTPTHQQQRQQHPISFLGSSEHKSKKTTPLSHAPVANPSIMMSLSSTIRTPYATSTMEPLEKGRAINLCDRANPCQNNGKCEWNAQTGQYICRCPPGFTNDNCTEPIDYDPCSAEPCQNGATCAAKASPEKGTEYDCFCSRGFAGRHCELKPCEENPCKNGGTCRTTRSLSLFFCACAVGWGGKTCMIAIPSSSEEAENAMQMDANFTQQLSSGRIEWIENMRLITSTLSTTTEKKNASGNFESTKDSSAGEDSLVLRRSKEYNYSHSTMPEQIIVEELPSIKLKSKEANGSLNTFAKKLDFKQIFLICFILHAFLPH